MAMLVWFIFLTWILTLYLTNSFDVCHELTFNNKPIDMTHIQTTIIYKTVDPFILSTFYIDEETGQNNLITLDTTLKFKKAVE